MAGSREIHLVRRPQGMPTLADFAVVEGSVPATGEGEVRVQALIMSVDPYMRPRLNADQALNAPMLGGGIGRVVESRNPNFAEGQLVKHFSGFSETFVSNGQGLMPLVRDPALPLSVYMHALGGTGITAYGGLLETGKLKDGEQVFVSTAGGAVGSVVAQIAKIKGCRAVGIAGGPDKCRWVVEELGFDACIDYKRGSVRDGLKQHCPDGVDIYFDNVGGEILDTVLTRINRKARIVICGAISQYNNTTPVQGPKNYLSLLVNRARMEGMVVFDYADRFPQAVAEMAGYLKDGRMKSKEDLVQGLDAFPDALGKLFSGENFGKLVLQVASA